MWNSRDTKAKQINTHTKRLMYTHKGGIKSTINILREIREDIASIKVQNQML